MTVFGQPGAFTDQQDAHPGGPAALVRGGLRWLSFQAQNNAFTHDYDLGPYRNAGLSCGVWGVTYRAADFRRDGEALARQAVKLGAEHVIVDAEECAKGADLQPVVDGVRAGGWTGPISLSTLGAPTSPEVNDYRIDPHLWLRTGGFVLPQAYVNDWPEYRPERCVFYWTRVGVPRDRLNLTISFAAGDTSRVRFSGSEWAPLLVEAGLGPAWSAFMSQFGTEADYLSLKDIPPARVVTPEPVARPNARGTRAKMIELAKAMEAEWERRGRSPEMIANQRITMARVLLETSDTAWSQGGVRDAARTALGVEPPTDDG